MSGPSVCACADLWLVVQEKLKLVTVLGAGLLCGTALAVIIPEGVHALYEEILEGKVQPRWLQGWKVFQSHFTHVFFLQS